MFNPLFDRAPAAQVGALTISGGWLSFVSILLRFTLTVGAALMLVATTGMYRTAMALERLWVPRVFVLQLLFVYRYLFVLLDEAGSLDRARSLRSFGRPASVALFGRLAGGLLLRTLDRAQRIDQAMRGRGFDGTVRFLGAVQIKRSDVMFCVGWCVLFVLFRLVDVSQLLGIVLTGGTP
jgi:cobalt/nickel transport system permease protein